MVVCFLQVDLHRLPRATLTSHLVKFIDVPSKVFLKWLASTFQEKDAKICQLGG